MTPTPSTADRRVSRRTLLRAGSLTGLAITAGCSLSDPRVEGAGTGSSSKSPSRAAGPASESTSASIPTLPGADSGAAVEEAVAALAVAVMASTAELTAGQRRVVAAVRDAHRLHAEVLRTPDPTARSTADAGPGQVPAKPAKVSMAALIAAEKSLAGRHAKLVPSSRGLTALLFGSLSVAASTYASALGTKGNVPIAKPATDPPTPQVLDDVAGKQAVVAQLHAMIYGYQVAIGRLSVGSKSRDRALAVLTERRTLRDQLVSLLLARQVSVPAAEPAYVTSPKVRNAATASALIASLETAFVPFTGQWLAAAAQPSDQRQAWATMQRTASLARTWGGPISAWPGWPT